MQKKADGIKIFISCWLVVWLTTFMFVSLKKPDLDPDIINTRHELKTLYCKQVDGVKTGTVERIVYFPVVYLSKRTEQLYTFHCGDDIMFSPFDTF